MNRRWTRMGFAAAVILGLSASLSQAASVGTTLEAPKLTGYTQTGAKEYGDFAGRTVLFEFFAYW